MNTITFSQYNELTQDGLLYQQHKHCLLYTYCDDPILWEKSVYPKTRKLFIPYLVKFWLTKTNHLRSYSVQFSSYYLSD